MAIAAAAAGLAVAACSDTPQSRATEAPDGRSTRQWATQAVLAALTPDGSFAVSPHVAGPGEIDPVRASALAEAFARTFGVELRGPWEQEHGAPIAVDQLRACGPAAYARSPYAASPAGVGGSALPAFVQRTLGARYLVELCNGGVPAVSVAIVAAATDARIVDGRLAGARGPDFLAVGIPAGLPRSVVRPEDAALLAARATGRRVSEVPELILPAFPEAPQLARWRVTLDSAVRVRGRASGVVRATREVYAGFGATWRDIDVRASNPRASANSLTLPASAFDDVAGRPGARTAAPATTPNAAVSVPVVIAAGFAPGIESVEAVP